MGRWEGDEQYCLFLLEICLPICLDLTPSGCFSQELSESMKTMLTYHPLVTEAPFTEWLSHQGLSLALSSERYLRAQRIQTIKLVWMQTPVAVKSSISGNPGALDSQTTTSTSQKPDSASPPIKHRCSHLPGHPLWCGKCSVRNTDQPGFELASCCLLILEELLNLMKSWVSYLPYKEQALLSFHGKLSGLNGMQCLQTAHNCEISGTYYGCSSWQLTELIEGVLSPHQSAH